MADDRILKSGSQPYDDGSGFRFPVEIREDESGAYAWIGSDMDLRITKAEWEVFKTDLDRLFDAFQRSR